MYLWCHPVTVEYECKQTVVLTMEPGQMMKCRTNGRLRSISLYIARSQGHAERFRSSDRLLIFSSGKTG